MKLLLLLTLFSAVFLISVICAENSTKTEENPEKGKLASASSESSEEKSAEESKSSSSESKSKESSELSEQAKNETILDKGQTKDEKLKKVTI
ncbi:unnamed protein product, partial [Mesorhabditis belari]|uniref:Uncharacterized protein n=1 Tax=Mesorhabditis belari TaxID=2138241 RepID=A0AAF3EE21_9BILA